MDYLKEKFHQELAAEGNLYVDKGRIFIRDKHWAPEDVLQKISDEAYDEVFNEWLDERKTVLLDLADEILARYDNNSRFESLKAAYENGTVVPFVGAGMSMSSGYPGWGQYLRGICEESSVPLQILNELLQLGKYEEAAQILFDDLGAATFNEHLNNVFGNRAALTKRGAVGPVSYLPRFFKVGVITTNFDPVIEHVYDAAGVKFEDVMLGSSAAEFPRLKAIGKSILLKFHGHADRARDRILTQMEYDSAYANKGVIRSLVSHALFGSSLLFLGCSLGTDRTIQLMAEYVQEMGHENLPRHYAFLELKEGEDRKERRKALVAANIFPIWYEDVDHDEALEALIFALVEGVEEI